MIEPLLAKRDNAVDEYAPILGVKLRGETCRAHEVTEHDGDRTTFGGGR